MAQTKHGAMLIAAKKAGLTPDEYTAKVNAGLKRCTKCKQWHPLTDYSTDNSRYDGKQTKCCNCVRVKNPRTTKGRVSTFKGRKHTPESLAKMSASSKGNKHMLGKNHSLDSRKKISVTRRLTDRTGDKCPAYKDGKTAERRGQRFSAEYKRWRFDVFVRDKFTCQDCGDNSGGNLNAHHLKPFADYPELRFDVSNGITLCTICHKNRH